MTELEKVRKLITEEMVDLQLSAFSLEEGKWYPYKDRQRKAGDRSDCNEGGAGRWRHLHREPRMALREAQND